MPSVLQEKPKDESLYTFAIHKDAVSSLVLVGDTLYSGSHDCTVAKIDLHQGAVVHTFHGSQGMVHSLHEREGQVYIGNSEGAILMLDANSGQAAATLEGHKRAVTCLSSEENMLYSGSKDAVIRQWDLRMIKCVKKLRVHSGPVTSVQIVDGTLYSGSWDGTLYTLAGGEGRRHEDPKRNSALMALTSAAGLLYAAYRDGRARVWSSTTDQVVTTFVGHDAGISSILVDEQARMYLGSDDRTISVWDLKMQASYVDREKMISAYKGHTDGVLCLAKGDTLLYSGSYDHTIKIWDLKAIDRALVPGYEERSLPLHKLAEGGADIDVHAARADPDWWKTKRPLGGPHMQPRLGLRLDQNQVAPTVFEVFPDSVADFAGIRPGDQLTRLNNFDVPTVVLLQECITYFRPREAIELEYAKRLPNGNQEIKVAKFEVEDVHRGADGSVPSIVTEKQIIAGIYDVFDQAKPTAEQATVFKEIIEKNADLFRKVMLKYGDTNDASNMSNRSFWLLANQCKLVTPKMSLAELDRLFILNRIRQLYPDPRVDDIKSPHAPTVNLRIEDFIFGSVRLASRKYQKQSDNVLRFDRLIKKHFLPLALTNTPDVLSEVGLGNIDDALSYQQQRAVLKLFMKFSGQDVPEEAMRGAGFIQAIKSLNMPPPSSSEEHLLALLEEGCKLYSRPLKPNENLSGEAAMDREMVPDELTYCLALLGKTIGNKQDSTPLSQVLAEVIDRHVMSSVR